MTRHLSLLILALAMPSLALADDKLTSKEMDSPPPSQMKEEFRKLLSDKAVQVLDANGQVKCEIWFRKVIPVKATEAQLQNGLTYQEVPQTTVFGAIRFPAAYKDYRKQDVDPGVYVLRLAMQPQDGDHMGTAPYQEFCVITSPEFDTKPDVMEPKALIELSARTLSGSHPGVMLLFPNNKPAAAPQVADQGQGHWVLKTKLDVDANGKKGVIGIGLTVAGQSSAVN